jgi:sugar phosphate isomerase/epimerase
MLDTWHFAKGNADFELLRSLPAERLVSVQVADALLKQRGMTLFEDTVKYREFPGEGELPIVEILMILQEKGQLRRIGPEVFSDEADTLSPEAAGQRSGDSLWRVLQAAGIPTSQKKR